MGLSDPPEARRAFWERRRKQVFNFKKATLAILATLALIIGIVPMTAAQSGTGTEFVPDPNNPGWCFIYVDGNQLPGKEGPNLTPCPEVPTRTQPPLVQPTAQPPSFEPGLPVSENCGLDKISTMDESEGGGPRRLEVGGGGTQHVDYYPDRGVNTISYVVGPMEPIIWWGFGSRWEGQCGPDDFDYLADAAGYARGSDWQPGRLNNGHSGLVVDTRTCVLYDTVWNSLREDEQGSRLDFIQDLLETHRASQETIPCDFLTSRDVNAYSVPGAGPVDFVDRNTTSEDGSSQVNPGLDSTSQGGQLGCPKADVKKDPGTITVHGPAIAQPWWNNGEPSFGQEQVRVLIRSGQSVKILDMMGMVYLYKDNSACRANLDAEFANGKGLDQMTIQDLVQEGLARRVD